MENETELVDSKETTASTEESAPAEEDKQKEAEIDYKSELEKEKLLRVRAESYAQKYREKIKKIKDEETPETESTESYNPPLDIETLRQVIREETGVIQKSFAEKQVRDAIASQAQNTDEADLIQYHYENTIRSSGDMVTDIRRAKALANEKRLVNQLDEAKAALKSKELRSGAGSSGGQKAPTEATIRLSPGDQKMINDIRKDGWVLSSDTIRKIVNGEDTFMNLVDQGVIKKAK